MLARIISATVFAAAMMVGTAHSEDIALAKNSMRLFGGPSMDYPRIGMIAWGQGLKVLGCEKATGWCEIIADGQRGWVPSAKVELPSAPKGRTLDRNVSQVTI